MKAADARVSGRLQSDTLSEGALVLNEALGILLITGVAVLLAFVARGL